MGDELCCSRQETNKENLYILPEKNIIMNYQKVKNEESFDNNEELNIVENSNSKNKKIEYILMDLEMPYLNGVKTCNIIKSIKEINIPVFILSGDEPKDCSADGYCNKPLNEIDIINKLDKER